MVIDFLFSADWTNSQWNCCEYEATEYKHRVHEAITCMYKIKFNIITFLTHILGTDIPCWL
jgi:hypothetical protein